jgi:ABC-2 type transport system ATP-binding protein
MLVLDEPLTGMDPGQRARFIELVRTVGAAGVTVLVSSHILAEVERLASQVLVLVGGRLAASGDFHAIRDLMADQPRTVMVRASDARLLATGLIGLPTTVGVEVDGDALRARTRSVEAFATALPRLARDAGVSLREVRTTDESLEQVFHYLVRRR